jgi:hypothetical protein
MELSLLPQLISKKKRLTAFAASRLGFTPAFLSSAGLAYLPLWE